MKTEEIKQIPEKSPLKRLLAAALGAFSAAREKFLRKTDAQAIADTLTRLFSAVCPAVFAALLAGKAFPLSTYPLGIALLAAAGEDTPFFALGVLCRAVLSNNLPLSVGSGALIVLRILFSKFFCDRTAHTTAQTKLEFLFSREGLFAESQTLRLCTAALGAFTMGMIRIIAGGFSMGDLMGTCLCVLLCPALCYLYVGCFSAGERAGVRYEAGLVALLVSFVYAISEVNPLGFSAATTAAATVSFLLARRKNPFTACLFALLSILAANPLLSPAFAVAAALSAILYAHSRLYAVCIGSIAFAAVTYFTGGVSLFADYFPEFVAGAALSAPFTDAAADALLPFFRTRRAPKETAVESIRAESERERIRVLSEAFDNLSHTFFALSDRKTRPGIFDTRQICDRVCDRYCKKCPACALCWERDYAVTLDTLNKASARLYKTGKVTRTDLPQAFLSRCDKADRLLEDFETENRRAIKKLLETDKTRAFAVDYAVFSRVLTETLQKSEAEFAPNASARRTVTEALAKIGFKADSIEVYGNRNKSVYAYRLSSGATKCTADLLRGTLGEAIGGRVEEPLFEFSEGGIHMVCKQAPGFSLTRSIASAATHTEENGDRVTAFDGTNGYSYALVSDGMGSGSAAARKSDAAAIFLEKMLRAGNSVSAGMEMLAALARADGEEVFTTVDLFEFDAFTGRGAFVKSGAAPSFVKRGSRLFKIRSKTFPLGILEDVDAERTTFDCEDGDAIVILSDGVTEDIEEPLWLCELLSTLDLSASDAAEKILDGAKSHTLCRDDMTAAVLTVRKLA